LRAALARRLRAAPQGLGGTAMQRDTLLLPILGFLILIAIPAVLVLGTGTEEPADFVFDLMSEPETLDTALLSDQPGGRVANALFEGLLTRNPRTLAPEPGVAYRWEISPDGTRLAFHLRPCQWSNGDPVRAGDFVYQWRRILSPGSGARYVDLFFFIAGAEAFHRGESADFGTVGIQAPDDSTLHVRLKHPTPFFLDLCAFYPYFPANPRVVEAHGEDWVLPEHMVSNGPFLLAEWQLRRRIRLRKNLRYWDAAHVDLELVDAIFSEHASTAFNLYATGETDWIDSTGIPPSIRDAVLKRPDLHTGPYFNTYFYRINVTRPPFGDKRVRQALNLAIDKRAIVEHITRSGQIPALHLVPPGVPGYTSPAGPDYDPERARALLAEAGFPGGRGIPSFEIFFNTSEEHRPIAEVIQQQWKEELGIQCQLVNQEWKVFLNSTRALEYDVSRGSWIGDYLDPSTFLDLWVPDNPNNRTGWSHPEYTRLVRAAGAETDPERRLAILAQAEAFLLDEAPILPIYFYVTLNCFDGTRWGGCEPNLLNMILLKHVYRKHGAAGGVT
jgi:oligopeptide transport system substrate-binding protein